MKIVHTAAYESKHGKGLKILNPEQMLQILLIALAKLDAGNTFEILLIEIRQIIYSLYRKKKLLRNYITI